jgi:hypothetical protein
MRKSDIGEHKIYLAIVLFENPERLNSMGCRQHNVTGLFQHLSYGPLQAFLVFHEKNRCNVCGGSDGSLVSPDRFNGFINARQIDLEGRALAQF